MDLSVFFQTTATLAPVLLAGTALAYRNKRPPRTRWGLLAFAVFLIIPPVVVLYYSLCVLAGFASAETWRLPVLLLLMAQLLTGLGGTADLVLLDKGDRALVKQALKDAREQHRADRAEGRDLRRAHGRQPHSQPHKPAPTAPHETARTSPSAPQNRTTTGESEPDVT